MTRVLITGSSGLLGLNLALESMNSYYVFGVDRGKLASAPFKTIQKDLLEKRAANLILDAARPDWLIHCAALSDIDQCEENPERARLLNTDLPGQLAEACASRNIAFVHISTDAVFDGEKEGYYTEADDPRPLNVYAQTKLEGEKAVLKTNPRAIVVRVNFYGWSLSGKRSLAEFFFYNLIENRTISGFTDVLFCPLQVNQLARILPQMLEKKLSGLYHAVGPQAISKYMFGVEIARKFGFNPNLISPKSVGSSGLAAKRSQNLSLSIHKLSTELGQSLPDFSTGLDEFYKQFKEGFPQKIRSYQQA